MLMFEQDACPWCEAWRREVGVVYDKTPEGRLAPLVVLDIADPLPEKYSLDYNIVYTPTFVVVEDGSEVGRIEGYPGEGFFWARLEKILE
ncbi:MAG TPA: thioredoxin family protein [Devosia sp.]|nr:thioredoxin family protein [Devosia sp.]